jgi:hypothetical protein
MIIMANFIQLHNKNGKGVKAALESMDSEEADSD